MTLIITIDPLLNIKWNLLKTYRTSRRVISEGPMDSARINLGIASVLGGKRMAFYFNL